MVRRQFIVVINVEVYGLWISPTTNYVVLCLLCPYLSYNIHKIQILIEHTSPGCGENSVM